MSYIHDNGEWWVNRLYGSRIQVHLGERPLDVNKYWDSAWGGDALAICQRWDAMPKSVKAEIVKESHRGRAVQVEMATHTWKWRYFGFPSCAYTWIAIVGTLIGIVMLLRG
jgi:hypothetical protein